MQHQRFSSSSFACLFMEYNGEKNYLIITLKINYPLKRLLPFSRKNPLLVVPITKAEKKEGKKKASMLHNTSYLANRKIEK